MPYATCNNSTPDVLASDQVFDSRLEFAFSVCDTTGASETSAFSAFLSPRGIEIARLDPGNNGSPLKREWVYDTTGIYQVVGLSCDDASVDMVVRRNNQMQLLSFPRVASDITLTPTSTAQPMPASCSNYRSARVSFDDKLHIVYECDEGATRNFFLGEGTNAPEQFASGPADDQFRVSTYAYHGGNHLVLVADNRAFFGQSIAELKTERPLNFEANRLTFLTRFVPTTDGFFGVGLTVKSQDELLPAKFFAGPTTGVELDALLGAGTALPTLVERRTITTTDDIGGIRAMDASESRTDLVMQTLQKELKFFAFWPTGEVRMWGHDAYTIPEGWDVYWGAVGATRASGNLLLWSEESAGVHQVKAQTVSCF